MLLAVVTAVWCASCSKDDDEPLNVKEGEGVITMVVNAKGDIDPDEDVYFAIYSFKEGEIITVDWGDGQVEEFRTTEDENEEDYLKDEDEDWFWTDYLGHSYERHKYYTITIRGNIKGLVYILESDDNNVSPLTSLDVSKCPALEYLNCFGNHLTSLNVSKNPALKELWCYENALTSLDVSGCTALKELDCGDNNLTSLDVSRCPALEGLYCFGNPLTSLDVSKNLALEELDCCYNNLTSLDVSKNTNLKYLDCGDNKFSASALNKIFNDLPQGKTWVEDGYTEQPRIFIYGNPGTKTCDKSIAEKKGWRVYDNW